MRIDDLHLLPKVRDSGSFVYLQYGRLEQDDRSVCFVNETGRVPLPIGALSLVLLGPGTTVTQRAIINAAECGCTVAWAGEEGVRLYATGLGDTRSASRLLRQAEWLSDPDLRLRVVRRMYEMRFSDDLPAELTLQQIRGREGARVRDAYRAWSHETGVPWEGRRYRRDDWDRSSPVNRALSAANSCLYGVCHAAIVSAGYGPGLGFVHTGKALSFVYDVADLYKTETSVPAAFRAVQSGAVDVERAARHALRDQFHETRLLGRIVDDLARLFDLDPEDGDGMTVVDAGDADLAKPSSIWDPDGAVPGGRNYGESGGGRDG
ncbi:MAG: type I-E CRISPR-associated endonuclease Cas1e [Solirubrobacteraceae bacterium]|nr:type I-E CRISPR-associated endonuclease Cas1e [Solirubrobacteraceae bacterium]